MKNIREQLFVGILCLILGFALTYQYKVTQQNNEVSSKREYIDLTSSIKSLEKKRDLILKKVDGLQKKVENIEVAAAGDNSKINDLKQKLDTVKEKSGLTDLQGSGVIITLGIPDKLEFETNQLDYLADMQKNIISIINDLNSIGTLGITINDERYVTDSRIIISDSFIEINGKQFSPVEDFVIKARCNLKNFEKLQKIPGNSIEDIKAIGYNIDVNEEDNLKILKYNKALTYKIKKNK